MQSKEDLEKAAEVKDQWNFKTNPDDLIRKKKIIYAANFFCQKEKYSRALDIGAHEGWITQDLPAKEIFGYEISDNAAKRFPLNVKRMEFFFDSAIYPCDLVIATGVLYNHYDWSEMIRGILIHASNIVITCNIKEWEERRAIDAIETFAREVHQEEFPYREYTQKLRVFKV